ncbi:uncharacterized protein EI90DRAFT_414412 [Cantharellus anzutake]|uniref:uncharacterized protein n=1 Tax=Cantharellus anzutake TaxID=1750568 RepID=UPI0019090391|nr:uncharacterized protein EI90DRAFT_414412 [Cantharellus anzutake]KAF8314830.1 hypothetical protein EI90DRAFT_414412 [Cantharellus anzutake]
MISSDPDMPASMNPQSLTCEQTKLLRNTSGNSASPYLRAKCPQCFGGSVWGSPANELVLTSISRMAVHVCWRRDGSSLERNLHIPDPG